ncbi:LOW QUALITY PROTEIN: uncharacterized protein C10orf67 homolog, mitochondrial [Alca torda]
MAPPAASHSGGRARPALSAPPAVGSPLGLRALPCGLEEPKPQRRPCISDDLKIGYYSTDHDATDVKEIPELKELAIATQALIKLIHSLQRDLFIYKSIIQAQYVEKIEEQASNLCKYINDLTDVEFFHKQVVFQDDNHEKKMLEKENEDFKEEVFELHNEISCLENALKHSEKEKYFLDKQVQRMPSKMEADEQTLHKLIETEEQMKAELENERSVVKTLGANPAVLTQFSVSMSLATEGGKEDTKTKVQSVVGVAQKKENEHGDHRA